MSIIVDSRLTTKYNNPALNYELSKTDSRIVCYINNGKVIVLLGMVIAVFCSPFSLQLIGLSILANYSLSTISSVSALVALSLTVNTLYFAKFQHKRKELQNHIEKSNSRMENMPIGLKNRGANCWANSMIQFMMSIPILKDKVFDLSFFNRLYGVKAIFSTYQRDEINPEVHISSVDSQKWRRILSERGQNISSDACRQEDPHEAFTVLSDLLPKINLRKKITYSSNMLPKPKPFDGEDGRNLSILNERSFFTIKNEPFDFISLSIPKYRIFTPSLLDLIDNFFNSSDVSDTNSEFDGIDGALHRYNAEAEQYRFITAPTDLFFSLKRFVQTISISRSSKTEKMECTCESWKIDSKVKIPFVLHLKKETHIAESDANYELDSFIIHKGGGIDSGHYISIVKKNKVWYECNDEAVRVISEEKAMDFASFAYLVHYSKIE